MTDPFGGDPLLIAVRASIGVGRGGVGAVHHEDRLLRQAELHGVVQLLAAAPEVVGVLSGEFRSALEERAREVTATSLGQLRELHGILTSLRAVDIPAVSFKGPTLSQVAYGDPGRRPSIDVDIVVPRRCVRAAAGVLFDAGYAAPGLIASSLDAQIRVGREFGFVGPQGSLVEVQWAFAPSQDGVRLLPGMLRRAWTQIGSVMLPTFEPSDLLVALAVHAARERWWRLLWAADTASLTRRADIDWDRVVELSERGGVSRITRISLALASRLLEVDLPSHLGRWMRNDAGTDAWVERIVAGGDLGGVSPAEGTLVGLHDRRIDDARSAVRWLATPTLEDLRVMSLPRVLAPAYVVLRPIRLALARWRGRGGRTG